MGQSTRKRLAEDLNAAAGKDLAAFLEQKIELWSFPQLLEGLYRGDEPLRARLERKLLDYEPGAQSEAVARKVRNWISGRNLPSNREELFKISFALGLDEAGAECVLGTTAECGVHFRNPKELVYAYALRTGLDYPQALRLAGELWGEPIPGGTLEFLALVKASGESEDQRRLTASVRDRFKRVRTEADLRRFFEEYRPCLGFLHNTAYRKFRKMLETLLFPRAESAELPADRAYSVELAVEKYLRLGMPYGKRTSGASALQKKLKEHWPTPKRVRDMYARRLDVDRKTLLLLYVATEGVAAGGQGTPADWLREHEKRLGLLLSGCGMAALNPHSPFDYLILQAVRKERENDFMSLRMEAMIRGLYAKPAAFVAAKHAQRGDRNAE